MKTHRQEVNRAGQRTEYREMASHNGTHIRITIETDSTPSQSSAHAETLGTDRRWHPITEIHPGAMVTDHRLAYKPATPTPADYRTDATRLRTETARLLEEPT